LLSMGSDGFWSLVGEVTVLLPNRTEAQVLAGQPHSRAALTALLARARVVVVKLDREGCLAGTGGSVWHVPAPPGTIINATGAGDAFNAAFLARWLEDEDVEAACRAGVKLGTHAATLPGTR
jgi:ribokinase